MVNIVTGFRFYYSNFSNFFRPTAHCVKHFQIKFSDVFKPRNPSFPMKYHIKFWCLNRQWWSYSCWSRDKTLIVLPYWTLSWIASLESFLLNTCLWITSVEPSNAEGVWTTLYQTILRCNLTVLLSIGNYNAQWVIKGAVANSGVEQIANPISQERPP